MKNSNQKSLINTPFDWVKELYLNKKWAEFSEEEKSKYNIFMINKILSMDPQKALLIQKVNMMNLTKEYHFQYLQNILKGTKNTYVPYIKNEGKTKSIKPEIISAISKYYNISTREAYEYYQLIDKSDITHISKIKWE